MSALHLALFDMAHAGVDDGRDTPGRLADRLASAWAPTRAGLQDLVVSTIRRGFPTGLTPEERGPLLGRAAARALDEVASAALPALVEVVSEDLAREADRWESFAETVDLLAADGLQPGSLREKVRGARKRAEQLAAPSTNPAVAARRQALLQALAEDLGIPAASAALRSGGGDDIPARVAAALDLCPLGEPARRVLLRRASLLVGGVHDVIDEHLSGGRPG